VTATAPALERSHAASGIARVRTGGPQDGVVRVSVVVSTRDHAQYLPATVRAVERQVGVAHELVVVDNASPDDTEAAMHGLLDSVTIPVTYVRLAADQGPAGGRNVGIDHARGEIIAFTDSDCVPEPGWLQAACASLAPGVGVVQGRTTRTADAAPPFFSHFIETPHYDGSFSTSNVVYRREAIGTRRFDAACRYWEDTDLGWRVVRDGWTSTFAPGALVRHQVVPQSAVRWLLWTARFGNWPAKAAAHPGFRRSLFLRTWAQPIHALLELAVVGLIAGRRWRRARLLALPYAVATTRLRGLGGRAPLVKAGAHLIRDVVGVCTLLVASLRHRSVVL
jgi:glycosyltransferase involved in cell wall biosynthesis